MKRDKNDDKRLEVKNNWKKSRWVQRQERKKPRYFCTNCLHKFRTGKFWWNDYKEYDDICPYCGAVGETFEELCDDYKSMVEKGF